MKHTRKIIADDGEHRIEIIIKQKKKANWESGTVTNHFENVIDSIIKNVLLCEYHNSDIKVVKS
jgi:hypothetical protein